MACILWGSSEEEDIRDTNGNSKSGAHWWCYVCVFTDFVQAVRQVFGEELSGDVMCVHRLCVSGEAGVWGRAQWWCYVCSQTLCERWGRCLGRSCRPGATASAAHHSCPQTPRPPSLLHRWVASAWRGTEPRHIAGPINRNGAKKQTAFFHETRQWALPFCAQQSGLMMSWTSPECVAEMRTQWVCSRVENSPVL